MAIKKLIKRFEFNATTIGRVDLSGGLVIGLRRPRGLLLPRQVIDYGPSAKAKPFSVSQDLTARTWVSNPKALRQWLGFQIERRQDPPSPDPEIAGTPVTIRFRLTNGTNDFWHDGASWAVVADPSHWNSESEIADQISTFPTAGRKLGIVVNMFTVDERVTPLIRAIKVLYEADVNEAHDIVYESLIPGLRSARARGRVGVVMESASASIDFSDLKALGFQSEYKIVGIASAYNTTSDPENLTDVADSFDENTKILTLVSPASIGDLIWVNFYFEPTIAVQTTRDFYEVSTLPRIDVTDISTIDILPAGSSTSAADSYFHPTTGQGFKIPGPREFDLFAVLEIIGDKAYDVTSMREAVARWVSATGELAMAGTDEEFEMVSEGQADDESSPNEDDIRVYKMPISVLRVTSFDLPAEASAAPQSIVFEGGNLEFEITKA